MKKISLKSYGKVNLCLEVLGRQEDGYHRVESIMQAIDIWDCVDLKWIPYDDGDGGNIPEDPIHIEIECDHPLVPTDGRNIAWKAVEMMSDRWNGRGKLEIKIKKNIPVAAGLAGGSGNGAAVMHGLNRLWDLGLDLEELLDIGANLGADVPFALCVQAAKEDVLHMKDEEMASTCSHAEGIGTQLTRLNPLGFQIVLSKPSISVSTREVYTGLGLDKGEVVACKSQRVEAMVEALAGGDFEKMKENMVNCLEKYTLKRYHRSMYTKNILEGECKSGKVLMSGSGPTIYAVTERDSEARRMFEAGKKENQETFLTQTLV